MDNFEIKLMFEAEPGDSKFGSIAIDDVRMWDGSCALPTTCDFETGSVCFLKDDDSSNFAWSIYPPNKQSITRKPSVDHTLGTPYGHYAYVE